MVKAVVKKTPTPEQYARLRDFAAQHGRNWKDTLSDMWQTGRDASQPDGHLLRQVRNQFGPQWLYKNCDF